MIDIQSFATDDFVLEHLTDSKGHLQLLDSFSVANNATGLERYLKSRAILDEARNESRTYLVKDVVSGELACYFSLRTGLITVSAVQRCNWIGRFQECYKCKGKGCVASLIFTMGVLSP